MGNAFRWRVLAFTYIFTLTFVITFQGIPPVFGFIVSSLGISHAQVGALMASFALPGIFISIPGGILADVYGSRRVGTAALAIATIGSLLVGFGNSFSLLIVGRIISGIGALTIAIVAPQTLSCWFEKGDSGKAMGIFNTAMPFGTILTLNVFGRLADVASWRVPLLLTSVYCLLVLVLAYFKYPGLPEKSGQLKKPNFEKIMYALRKTGRPVWLVAIIWMMFSAVSASFVTFAGGYYLSAGYDIGYAGFLTSLFMIGSFLLSPLVGYLIDRFGRQEYLIIGGSAVLAFLLLLVPRIGLNPLLIGSLIAVSVPLVPAPVFSLVPKFLPSEQVGLGYGMLTTCMNFGVLIGPLLIGLSHDWTQNYLSGFNLMATFALSTAAIALLLRFLTNRGTC